MLARHFGYVPVNWVYGRLSFLRDRRDQFFDPLRDSVLTYLLALPAGLRYNRAHQWKYVREWLSVGKASNLRRLWTPRNDAEGFPSKTHRVN